MDTFCVASYCPLFRSCSIGRKEAFYKARFENFSNLIKISEKGWDCPKYRLKNEAQTTSDRSS
jgi:hypothetical protein